MRTRFPSSFIAALLGVIFPVHAGMAESDAFGFDAYRVASNQELSQMRGGFDLSDHGIELKLSFGIERYTFLGGQLVAASTLEIPALNAGMATNVSSTLLDNTRSVIQNGSGNTFTIPNMQNLSSSQVTLIQNSLDNQVIGNLTFINMTVTSLQMARTLAATQAINQGINGSLR